MQEPRYAFAGMLQFHPDGSALFHHRTAHSKLPACGGAKGAAAPPTHLSAPFSHTQAEASMGGSWHLRSTQVRVVRCGVDCAGCSLDALTELDAVCSGRSEATKHSLPLPVTLVEVPPNSLVGQLSAAAVRAYELLPFH